MTTAWGFSNLVDEDWKQSACKDSDPDLFEVTGKYLSPENKYALTLCDTCPIREKCLSKYLKDDLRPRGIAAGGWWWDNDGRGHPNPRDRGKTIAGRTVRVRAPGTRNGRIYTARRAITAARAVIAGQATRNSAVAAHRLTLGQVDNAIAIVRWVPELLDEVWDGTRTLTSAHQEATARLQSAHREQETARI